MKNVLVTGGAGFIGSSFLEYMVEKYPDYNFVCLDALTYAGNYNNISELIEKNNFTFVKGNISKKFIPNFNFSSQSPLIIRAIKWLYSQ